MARLYADENFAYSVVAELRRLGHDVLTCREAGQAGLGIGDPAVLAFVTSLGRAVLTFDHRDFQRLHRQAPSHAGIIDCTYDPDSVALAGRIRQAIHPHASLDGLYFRIVRPHTP
jgi:Domain of unknown function (DUF5615)